MDKARLVSDIKQAEGLRTKAYRDSLGFWTGGYGHLLDQAGAWDGTVFSEQQCDDWLLADVAFAVARAKAFLEWAFLDTDARQNAVCELVFNMGSKWRLFAKARQAICKQDWQIAHDELLNSLWAKQVGQGRSNRLANYLLTGAFA